MGKSGLGYVVYKVRGYPFLLGYDASLKRVYDGKEYLQISDVTLGYECNPKLLNGIVIPFSYNSIIYFIGTAKKTFPNSHFLKETKYGRRK